MAWIQLSVSVPVAFVEAVSVTFVDQGAASVSIVSASDAPVLEPDPGEQRLWARNKVVGLFQDDIDPQAVLMQLRRAHGVEHCSEFFSELLPDRQWERVWLEDFKPLQFGRRLHIIPDCSDTHVNTEDTGRVALKLDPGLAFGTGTHPTTAMCLTWLDGLDLASKTVLDFGCGSGILGIAAALLGAQQVVCVDHDPQALIATRENAQRNNVLDKLIVISPQEIPQQYLVGVIVANILAQPLIVLADQLLGYLAKDGSIGLSGILTEQMDSVTQGYANKCCFEAPVIQEPWCCITGRKV